MTTTMSITTDQLSELFNFCEAEESTIETDDALALAALRDAHRDPSFDPSQFGAVRDEHTLLAHCCGSGKTNSAIFLLTYAPETASIRVHPGVFPLHWAAGTGDLKLAEAVYKAYPDALDAESDAGETPLEWAIDSEAPEVVKFLIDQGALVHPSLIRSPSEYETERSEAVRQHLFNA